MAIKIQQVLIHEAPKPWRRAILTLAQWRRAILTLALVSFLGATLCILVALPEWSGWTTPLLVIVPATLTIAVMRFSVISAAYLMLITINFGVTSMILGSHWQPLLVSLVLTWSLAIAIGTIIGGPSVSRPNSPASELPLEPRWPHYVLSGGLIGVSLFLTLSHSSGYAGQILNGNSTPTGILGTLSVVSPIVTLILVLSCMRFSGRSKWAIALAAAQILVLALSGFRGAVAVFMVSIFVGAALTLPRGSAWRRGSRLVVVLPLVLILTIFGFVLAANVKNTAAAGMGISSAGTQLFTLDNAVVNTVTRMQIASSLDTALKYRNDSAAKEAVSWPTQVEVAVPRFLWPDKPIVDYGQRVSVAMYGLTSGYSSGTVTTIGDSLLNFGLVGLLLTGLLVGYAFRWVSARVDAGTGGLSILVAVIVIYSGLNQEQPIVLMLIGILRNGLVAGALWAAATFISRFEMTHRSSQ